MQVVDNLFSIVQKSNDLIEQINELAIGANSINKAVVNALEGLRLNSDQLQNIKLTDFNPTVPEVYINSSEVQRLLGCSAPAIISFVEIGLLLSYNQSKAKYNKFLLREVLWLKEQNFKHAKSFRVRQVKLDRKRELGY